MSEEEYTDEIELNMGDPETISEGPEDPLAAEESGAGGPEALGGLLVTLCKRAEEHFGLRVAECDAPGAPSRWGPVHQVHATGSYHYAHRAADISGLPQSMNRFTRWVARNNTPRLAELIHNPNGSVKHGETVAKSFWGADTWASHANHVHLAV
jgi:hypothetical protein